jgi:hypothetical protein
MWALELKEEIDFRITTTWKRMHKVILKKI